MMFLFFHITMASDPPPDLKTLNDTIVIAFTYYPELLQVNSTNQIIFMSVNCSISKNDRKILAKADAIITNSSYSARCINPEIVNYRIPVYRLPCFIDAERYKCKPRPSRKPTIGRHSRSMSTKFSKDYAHLHDIENLSFLGITEEEFLKYVGAPLVNATFKEYTNNVIEYLQSLDIYLYLLGSFKESWCRSVSEAMLSGLPIIVQNREPFTEYIFHGHNGFLIDNISEIKDIIKQDLSDVAIAGQRTMMSIMNPDRYIANLERIFDGNYPDQRSALPKLGTWVFSEKKIATRHKVIGDIDLLNALSFVSRLNFKDAYIFLDSLPVLTPNDRMKLFANVKKLGNRGLKFHICTDIEIPEEVKPVFATLSIISKEEGLKQIRA